MPTEHRNVSLSRRHFDGLADVYDSSFISHVPAYAEMHETILEVLALDGRQPGHVLELGTGTGALTHKLLERFPRTRVTGLDLSAAMLARARSKLVFAGSRVVLREADMSSADLGSGFDAVVSAIAFHHVPPRRKAAVFRQLYRGLSPGGVIVIGDTFRAASPELADRLLHCTEGRLLGTGMSRAAIEERRQRAAHSGGSAARLRDYERWLIRAGFDSVDCLWKQYNLAVVYGEKGAVGDLASSAHTAREQ